MTGWDETGRCGCDQWGRCLVDCPSAHLPYRDTPLGRKFLAEIKHGRQRGEANKRAAVDVEGQP
jgi:hypothetical protein